MVHLHGPSTWSLLSYPSIFLRPLKHLFVFAQNAFLYTPSEATDVVGLGGMLASTERRPCGDGGTCAAAPTLSLLGFRSNAMP